MNVFDYFLNDKEVLDKNFILNEEDKVSYSDLYKNSLNVAGFIKNKIGENKKVLLISHNSSFFITIYLGILKSGNICVPINFNIEQKNLDHITRITECDLAFVTKQAVKRLNFSHLENVIDEVGFSEILNRDYKTDFNQDFDQDKLAEIIFTSGSMGEPKGVMISHKNIIANTNSILEYLRLTPDDIICVVLPFYYCYGLSLLHTHLKIGGSVVLNNTFMFLGTVIKDLLNYKCTGFSGVPSHFQMLLKKSDSFKTTEFPDLRYVTQAGGKLPNSFIKEFISSFPDKEFYVMYGQTEATARLSYLDPKKLKNKLGSIGKGIPNVELKIVDKNGGEVGPGTQGELIAKGDNIMKGYFKDSGLTNTILQNNWLYTGDIAKKDKDGDIFIVGRKKEIMKIGGNRISPKEIEEVISSVSGVIDCTITAINDDLQGEAIMAYIVINDLNMKERIQRLVLKKCKDEIATYKIPRSFKFSDKLNVKLTGKK